MDENHDIYQKPPEPPPATPLPSYDLLPDDARRRAKRQTTVLVGVMAALLVLAAIHFIVQESHWTKTEQLREALSRPVLPRTVRTNALTGSFTPEVAPLEDNLEQTTEAPPPNVSPARMAEAMAQAPAPPCRIHPGFVSMFAE